MSFCLKVYLRDFNDEIDRAWAERMSMLGLRCVYPPGFSLLTTYEVAPILCTVSPPLTEREWEPLETGLCVDRMPFDAGDKWDAEKSRDLNVREVMASAREYFNFYTTSGRADIHLLMQCYGAAALADVGRGVIVDEDLEMAYGWAAYTIAHKNTRFIFRLPPEPKEVAPKPSFWNRWFRAEAGK